MTQLLTYFTQCWKYLNRVYHLHKSIPFTKKTTAKAWTWYQRRNGTPISVWNISSGKKKKQQLPFQMFRWSRKFSDGATQKVVFHLLPNWIFRKIWSVVNNHCSLNNICLFYFVFFFRVFLRATFSSGTFRKRILIPKVMIGIIR